MQMQQLVYHLFSVKQQLLFESVVAQNSQTLTLTLLGGFKERVAWNNPS